MKNRIFGEVQFNMGWETKRMISFFGVIYEITVSAAAYYETDKITKAQETSYEEYLSDERAILSKVQEIINRMENGRSRYIPSLLLIQENGDYALLFNDKEDKESGIAVTIRPKFGVEDVDQYL